MSKRTPETGDAVRDKKWGGRHTGAVKSVDANAGTAIIAWYGTVVEDELFFDEFEVIG